jgi:hypothetical protein
MIRIKNNRENEPFSCIITRMRAQSRIIEPYKWVSGANSDKSWFYSKKSVQLNRRCENLDNYQANRLVSYYGL